MNQNSKPNQECKMQVENFQDPIFFSLLPKKDQTNRNSRKISTDQETLKIPIRKTLDFRAYLRKSRRRTLQPDQPNRIVHAVEKIAQNLVPARIPQLNQNIEIKIKHKPTAEQTKIQLIQPKPRQKILHFWNLRFCKRIVLRFSRDFLTGDGFIIGATDDLPLSRSDPVGLIPIPIGLADAFGCLSHFTE